MRLPAPDDKYGRVIGRPVPLQVVKDLTSHPMALPPPVGCTMSHIIPSRWLEENPERY
jgi:hypothetical protein